MCIWIMQKSENMHVLHINEEGLEPRLAFCTDRVLFALSSFPHIQCTWYMSIFASIFALLCMSSTCTVHENVHHVSIQRVSYRRCIRWHVCLCLQFLQTFTPYMPPVTCWMFWWVSAVRMQYGIATFQARNVDWWTWNCIILHSLT